MRQSVGTSAVSLVAVGTGLLLDLTVAALFGAGAQTDAFVLAARVPLGLASIAMVVSNQILVPTLTTWLAAIPARRERRLMSGLVFLLVVGAVLIAGLVHAVAGPVVHLLAPGFEPRQTDQAAGLLRVMSWYLPFVVLAEIFRAWLNARHRFVVPAAMTLFLNCTAIAVLLLGPRSISVVPVAYVVGAVAQAFVLGAYAAVRGLRPSWPALRDADLWRTMGMLRRPAAGAALNPVMRSAELFCASFLPAGAATLVHFGNRLASAVAGTVVFRAVMVAVLPRQTRAWTLGERQTFDSLVRLGVRIMIYLAIPMGIIGAVIAWPMTMAVFTNGRFDAESASELGLVMIVYALSFPGSGLQRALLSVHYARRETRRPWQNTLIGVAVNLLLLPALVAALMGTPWAILAIPAAYTISQYAHVWHAEWVLRRYNGPELRTVRPDLVLSCVSSLAGGAAGVVVLTQMEVVSRAGFFGLAALTLAVALGVWAVPIVSSRRVRRVLRGARTRRQ